MSMIERPQCSLPVLGCRAVLAAVCKTIIRKMTSAPDENLAAEVRALGAAFLQKPFFPADIECAVRILRAAGAHNPRRI
jgi:hypothetical protein